MFATAGSSESSGSWATTRATPPACTPGPTSALWTDTYTRPFPAAIDRGLPPTAIVLTTLLLRGSIRDTVPSRLFATQTPPKPTMTSVGARPTGMVVVTELVAGSMRTTVSSRRSATQSAPAPYAAAPDPRPTGVVPTTSSPAGSMRATLSPLASLAQTPLAPTARLVTLLPVSIVAVTRLPAGSRCCREPASAATQRPSAPATTLASPSGSPGIRRGARSTTSKRGSIAISSG